MGGPSSGFAPRKNFLAMPLYNVGPLHPAMGSGERYELPQMSSPRGSSQRSPDPIVIFQGAWYVFTQKNDHRVTLSVHKK